MSEHHHVRVDIHTHEAMIVTHDHRQFGGEHTHLDTANTYLTSRDLHTLELAKATLAIFTGVKVVDSGPSAAHSTEA